MSQETTRIMAALNNTSAVGTPQRLTRSLRRFMHISPNSAIVDELDQELSDTQSQSTEISTMSSRKRKRENAAVPKATIKVEHAVSTEIHALPSKQTKRRQPAKKVRSQSGNVKVQPPSDWESMYSITKEMRQRIKAPVDTMGCERLADVEASPRDQRFQTLISLMLSSQTKDAVTAAAIRGMQSNLPGSLTLESILACEPERLNELIGKVGFHNTKTKNIKRTAEILRDQFNGDIPDTIEGLTSLPGVGPKMAYLTMSAAWGRDEGK